MRFPGLLAREHCRMDVRSTGITPFGVTHEVVVMVDGLNGRPGQS